jgi:hypothetical protein
MPQHRGRARSLEMLALLVGLALAAVALLIATGGEDAAAASPTDAEAAAGDRQPLERVDDPLVTVDPKARRVSPAGRWTFGSNQSIQVNVDAAGYNIVGDAANEPSIAVDPTAPNRMAIGWRQFDTVVSNFRQAGVGYSSDGGRSWTFPACSTRGVPPTRCSARRRTGPSTSTA